MRAIIIDDEIAAREILQRELKRHCPKVVILESCENLRTGLDAIKRHQPDVIFLDIELPNENKTGLALLDMLPSIDFEIVIVSAHKKYALDGFHIEAIDFIHKGMLNSMGDRLKEAVRRVEKAIEKKQALDQILSFREYLERQSQSLEDYLNLVKQGIANSNRIGIRGENIVHFYDLQEIYYWKTIKGTGNIQYFLADNKGKTLRKNLEYIEELLVSKDFFRIHHSHIINLNQIQKVNLQGRMVTMNNGATLDVSVSKFNDFRARIGGFTINLLDD